MPAVVLHAFFVCFVVCGGFLALRWRRVVWAHVPAAVWGAAIEFGGWICPLTPWENALRRAGGEAGYPDGFIEHYLLPLVYPAGLTRPAQMVFGGLVVVVNVLAYGILWNRWRRPPRPFGTRVIPATARRV